MANEEEEEKLDLTSRLVKNYQKANVALLERVSIMKEAYKEAAKENELVKIKRCGRDGSRFKLKIWNKPEKSSNNKKGKDLQIH